jgi:hypothetical protein
MREREAGEKRGKGMRERKESLFIDDSLHFISLSLSLFPPSPSLRHRDVYWQWSEKYKVSLFKVSLFKVSLFISLFSLFLSFLSLSSLYLSSPLSLFTARNVSLPYSPIVLNCMFISSCQGGSRQFLRG